MKNNLKMARRSVSGEDVAMRNLVDTSSGPSQEANDRIRAFYDSSSDSSLSIYNFPNEGVGGRIPNTFVRANVANERRVHDAIRNGKHGQNLT